MFFLFLSFFFFLKADYYVCLLVKRKKDGTVIGRTNSAHRTLDIAMYSDCSATANAWSLPLGTFSSEDGNAKEDFD